MYKRQEYLFIRANKDYGKHYGKYYPPSGWVEEGETIEDAIVRELMEELKLQIKPIKLIVEIQGDLPDLMLHFIECEIVGGEIEMDKVELNDVKWFSVEKLKDIDLWPATTKFFKEYMKVDL